MQVNIDVMFTIQDINLEITQDDIRDAPSLERLQHELNDLSNVAVSTPLTVALSRAFGTSWKAVGGLILVEEEAPFRYAYLKPSYDERALAHVGSSSANAPVGRKSENADGLEGLELAFKPKAVALKIVTPE